MYVHALVLKEKSQHARNIKNEIILIDKISSLHFSCSLQDLKKSKFAELTATCHNRDNCIVWNNEDYKCLYSINIFPYIFAKKNILFFFFTIILGMRVCLSRVDHIVQKKI